MTTLLSLTKKASVSLEAAAKPVNVILLEVIFDKPEIELANAKVTVSVPETVAVMLVEPAKFNTSPELIVCCVDELSLILKAVVTLVLISFIAATIDDVSVTPAETANEFKEYKYSVSGVAEFTAFQIKIVMKATNSAYPPKIKDLRGIALAV